MIDNKVAESGIITLDPALFIHNATEIMVFDLKEHLFMDLILKEKDFREALKQTNWSIYQNKQVAVTCTADAIIPVWAYMLIASYLQPVAATLFMASLSEAQKQISIQKIQEINLPNYTDKRIVLKGCGDTPIPEYIYFELTKILKPVAQSIMYGEPCSTVPVYKKRLNDK